MSTTTFEFTSSNPFVNNYRILRGGVQVGGLYQPFIGPASADLNGLQLVIASPLFGNSYFVRQPDSKQVIAEYAPEPFVGGIWQRLKMLARRAGLVTLDGTTYRFIKEGSSCYVWTTQDAPQKVLVRYRFGSAFSLRQGGVIEVAADSSNKNVALLVLLGLHLGTRGRDGDSAAASSVAATG